MFLGISSQSYPILFVLILGQSHLKNMPKHNFFLNFVLIKFTEIVVDLERL